MNCHGRFQRKDESCGNTLRGCHRIGLVKNLIFLNGSQNQAHVRRVFQFSLKRAVAGADLLEKLAQIE